MASFPAFPPDRRVSYELVPHFSCGEPKPLILSIHQGALATKCQHRATVRYRFHTATPNKFLIFSHRLTTGLLTVSHNCPGRKNVSYRSPAWRYRSDRGLGSTSKSSQSPRRP